MSKMGDMGEVRAAFWLKPAGYPKIMAQLTQKLIDSGKDVVYLRQGERRYGLTKGGLFIPVGSLGEYTQVAAAKIECLRDIQMAQFFNESTGVPQIGTYEAGYNISEAKRLAWMLDEMPQTQVVLLSMGIEAYALMSFCERIVQHRIKPTGTQQHHENSSMSQTYLSAPNMRPMFGKKPQTTRDWHLTPIN
jgi:hypothetical protein